MKKVIKVIGIIIGVLAALAVAGYITITTHPQIIVGAIQSMSKDQINTQNLYEPLNEPYEGLKENEQYLISEINYSSEYPNSYLDITYPDSNIKEARPTLFYFHGGGFFGGSKTNGDPLAESEVTALIDDICAQGFNIVNVDYAFVPEYLFPTPLIQANLAFEYMLNHKDEYHLDMNRVVIMGSSAGATITSQLGSIISNPEYAELLGITPVLSREQVKALVIDDAPLVYNEFSLGTKILVGNYVKGTIYLKNSDIEKYNNILWVNSDCIPAVLLGSEYYSDMRCLAAKLDDTGVTHELIDPLAERGLIEPHCFVANERNDEVSKDAFDRMIAFLRACLKSSK